MSLPSGGRSSSTMVTQMYTFNSWSKGKSPCGTLPYVGFPGLSLTPIPESPLLMDSILTDDVARQERYEQRQDLLPSPVSGSSGSSRSASSCQPSQSWDPHDMKSGSLPKHWTKPPLSSSSANKTSSFPTSILKNGGSGGCYINGDVEAGLKDVNGITEALTSGGGGGGKNGGVGVNVHLVRTTTFLPKNEPMTLEQKRAHICKLLLFALCGFIIVAGIVLWIFSPAFT